MAAPVVHRARSGTTRGSRQRGYFRSAALVARRQARYLPWAHVFYAASIVLLLVLALIVTVR